MPPPMYVRSSSVSRKRRRPVEILRVLSTLSVCLGWFDYFHQAGTTARVAAFSQLQKKKWNGTISGSHGGVGIGGGTEEDTKKREDATECRVAILYSGHVRSFAHPRVYLSHIENLIEPLKEECDVDVFMYMAVDDEVSTRTGMGTFAGRLAFTPHTPQISAVHRAVRLFEPVSVKFHQEQAGFIPSLCTVDGCHHNTFGQLYKLKAVYRMMEKHETEALKQYTWVIRSRPDVGWMLPMPPLSRFPPTRVYAGSNFFPLADQFLLMPRRFAETVFGAVRLCYACDVLKTQSESGTAAQTENLLRVALRRADIPFGFFEFPIVIVRYKEGGLCSSLYPSKLTCEILQTGGLLDGEACVVVIQGWYRRVCAEIFPPLDKLPISSPTGATTTTSLVTTSRQVQNQKEEEPEEQQTIERSAQDADGSGLLPTEVTTVARASVKATNAAATFRSEASVEGRAVDLESSLFPPMSVMFEVATANIEGMQRSLRDLSRSVRVYARPTQERKAYFAAHHYPFNQRDTPDAFDEIAVIAGFVLSEADFNGVAQSFACALDDVSASEEGEDLLDRLGYVGADGRGKNGRGGPDGKGIGHQEGVPRGRSPSPFQRWASSKTKLNSSVVLQTTTFGGQEKARVDCSLVDSMQDISLALLDREFEPSEMFCRGYVGPCLDRVAQHVPLSQRSLG